MLISYKTTDSAPKTQLALPIWVVQCAAKFYQGKNTQKESVIAGLLTITLYFLLRPGEYAMTTSYTSICIVQFRRSGIRFFKKGTVVFKRTDRGAAPCITTQ